MRALLMSVAAIALAGCGTPDAPEGTTLWHEQYFGADPTHRAVFDHHQDCRRFVAAMEALEQALEPDTRWFCK